MDNTNIILAKLNLPERQHRLKREGEKNFIFDPFRKKFLVLTPEEWVRQNFALYLVDHLGYPSNLVSFEHPIVVNKLSKRGDIVVFNRKGSPVLMVECKAPTVKIDQKVFDQIATYNLRMNVPVLVVTNGLSHYCCMVDHSGEGYSFLRDIPTFDSLKA